MVGDRSQPFPKAGSQDEGKEVHLPSTIRKQQGIVISLILVPISIRTPRLLPPYFINLFNDYQQKKPLNYYALLLFVDQIFFSILLIEL